MSFNLKDAFFLSQLAHACDPSQRQGQAWLKGLKCVSLTYTARPCLTHQG